MTTNGGNQGKRTNLVVTQPSLEKIAKATEDRGYAVNREDCNSLTIYGSNGTAHIRPGTPWRTVWAALKSIGVLSFVIYLLVAFFGG